MVLVALAVGLAVNCCGHVWRRFTNIHLSDIWINYIILDILDIQGNIGRDVTILDESKTSPILSHRVPIFPCILRKQEIQYYHYYLDHTSEMMNSLSEQKILKIDDTGNKFSKILGKYYETSFIHNSSFRCPWCNNRVRVVTMQACTYQLLYAESGRGFCSSCDHDCKQSSWHNNVQRFWL